MFLNVPKNKIHFLLASFELPYRPVRSWRKSRDRKFRRRVEKVPKNRVKNSENSTRKIRLGKFNSENSTRKIRLGKFYFENSTLNFPKLDSCQKWISGSSKIFEILLKFIENYWLEQWSMNDEISQKLFIVVYCNNSKH